MAKELSLFYDPQQKDSTKCWNEKNEKQLKNGVDKSNHQINCRAL